MRTCRNSSGPRRLIPLSIVSPSVLLLALLVALCSLAAPAAAQPGGGPNGGGPNGGGPNGGGTNGDGPNGGGPNGPDVPPSDQTPTSPVRRLERDPTPSPEPPRPDSPFRSIDGSGNNLSHADVGAAHIQLLRLLPADYADGVSALAGATRPSARAVSNSVCVQDAPQPNRLRVSDYLWQWGQFLDHDIDLTDGVDPAEPADIVIPTGDAWFDPTGTGTALMPFNRSLYDPETGTAAEPRQQVNEITAWIDASNVYGSDTERAATLRTLDGTGRLKTSDGDLLPFNVDGLANAGGPSPLLFLAGDVRANEQIGLTAMHTLFVREHNRQAGRIARQSPQLDGDAIYERARRLVGAMMQKITYDEFLPALLGPDALAPYDGYRDRLDPSIANLFSTAAYRFGHSTLSPTILRLGADGQAIDAGHLELRDAFFSPQLLAEHGVEPILRGLAGQVCQAVDPYVVDDLRNFLFGPPGSGGFDLASLNIQRGRDHGLPSYNDVREAYGLERLRGFRALTDDPALRQRLRAVYASVDEVDLWVGGLAERPRSGAMVGELLYRVIKEQFEVLRDGDRFWWRRALPEGDRRRVEGLTLADVIRRNTAIGDELPDDVFHVPAP
ncbi:MAG: peroxidase family protein [Acidobacteriota bacterium]